MSEAFKVVDKAKFDSVTVIRENHDELTDILKKYLDNPKHLIFNLDMFDEPTDEFLDQINFLSTILKGNNYSLQLYSPSDKVKSQLTSHRFRNLPEMQDLTHYIISLDNIERELRIESLLKSYVDETMKHFFGHTGNVIRRGELTLEDCPDNFVSEINYFQTFQMDNCFFSFVIGSNEEFFQTFLNKLGEKELAPVFNKIVSKIPEKLLQGIKIHDFLTHPYTDFPTEKVEIEGQTYSYFHSNTVMRIPLECDFGSFFLEVWIPKLFANRVYSFLNP